MINAIIASTSTLYGGNYLEYLLPNLEILFQNCKTILFIPFARAGGLTHNQYTQKVTIALAKINKNVVGLHQFDNYRTAINQSEAIFTGGGNTFVLVKALHDNNIMSVLATAINNGTPYLGTSAGSNIAGVSMQTTNDMPIVYPSSFTTMGILPFNLNPHYIDPDLQSKHMGETRETRITEFHQFNKTPVLGLREGSWLQLNNNNIILKGTLTARLFEQDKPTIELNTGNIVI